MKQALAIAVAILVCALGSGEAVAQNRYGEDLVRRLASPAEIRQATSIRAKLRKEVKTAEPLFVLTARPFADIAISPDVTRTAATMRPKQWYLPPWPSLDPALPHDLPEKNRLEIEAERNRQEALAAPTVFSDIPLEQKEVISAMLKPRVVAPGEEFVFRRKELQPPFSLRRYYESDENIFVELAAYGGTTWATAEEAYRAMKVTATNQEPMQGIGEEAFLTRVVVVDPATIPADEAPMFDGPPIPEAPPFPELAPQDQARPELLDSGSAVALEAPSFRDFPVADLEGKKAVFPSGPKKYLPKGGKVEQSLLVLVAYFPDQAVTLSFAIEERLGTVQDLVAIAILAQRKLREEIVAGEN